MKFHLIFFILLQTGLSFAQSSYCDLRKKDLQALVGKELKIYSTGGLYTTINQGDFLDWPSEEIRLKSGQNAWGDYYPADGEMGTVVHVFTKKSSRDPIFLLKIGEHYVPIGCAYVIDPNAPDLHEQSALAWKNDSIRNLEYAGSCIFKLDGRNGGCGGGYSELTKMTEHFCCALIDQGVDTILQLYYHGGNGETIYAYTGVIWADNGKFYLHKTDYDRREKPIGHATVPLDSCDLFDRFYTNRIAYLDDPKAIIYMSHEFSCLVQVYTPGSLFCQSLRQTLLTNDPEHLKSQWWNQIIETIAHNSTEH